MIGSIIGLIFGSWEPKQIDRKTPFMHDNVLIHPDQADLIYHTHRAHGQDAGEEEIRKTKGGRWLWLTRNYRTVVSEDWVRLYLQCDPETFGKYFAVEND